MSHFLTNLRVLDLTDHRGVLAGHMLAKLGADVVQIEPISGSSARYQPPFQGAKPTADNSLFWAAYGSGKRSVACDLNSAVDKHDFLALVKNADFLIESEDPGTLAALGLDYAQLRDINPALIYISITAFGSTGPKANYADSDLVVWASSGYLLLSRDDVNPPVRFSVPQAYLHAAADAVAGALTALFARHQSGCGQHVDVSAQQSTAITTLATSLAAQIGHDNFSVPGSTPPPKPGEKKQLDLSGSGSRTKRPKWQLQDGLAEMHLGIGPAAGRFANNMIAWMASKNQIDDDIAQWNWIKLPELLQNNEITDDDMERARTQVGNFLEQFTKAQLFDMAIDKKLLLAPIMTSADLVNNPHHADRHFYQTVTHPTLGQMTLPGAFSLSTTASDVKLTTAPFLGEHTQAVIEEWTATAPRKYPTAESKKTQAKPLSELKVLDLAWVVAGPVIGRSLADFGATVIRVESSSRIETARMMGPFPGGKLDPQQSGLYENCNAGKLGLCLDLSKAEGRAIVKDLVRWADVVVESFSPGQMANWGLGYDDLKTIKPDLIMLSTSLMGQSGPYSRYSGYGNIGAAVSGFQALVGWPDHQPIGPFGPYTDFVGPRFATASLLAALNYRRHSGQGCWLDVAQAEAGIQFLAPYIADYSVTGRVPQLMGNRDPQLSPNGVFPCHLEGNEAESWVAISVRSDDEWQTLARLIDGETLALDPRFITLTQRQTNENALEALLANWTQRCSAIEIEHQLQAASIPAHKVASTHDMAKDPQLIAREHFIQLPHSLMGTSVVESARFKLSETPGNPELSAPTFGRDSHYVLAEILNYNEEAISQLSENGILQ